MDKKLRWGILSTGRIADWFCGDFHQVAGSELSAVCSRSQESADTFGDRFETAKRFTSYTDLLADADVDCIYIGTPHTLHLEQAKEALRAGKAVLCEKPVTVGASECQDLINVARETGSFLQEAMWTYFLPAMRKAKAWCDEGRIGEITHIKTDFGYPVPYHPQQREYDASVGGGCLLEMGIYPIAIAALFAPGRHELLHAAATKAPNGVEDDVTVTMRMGETLVSLGTSFKVRLPNTAYIVGTKGRIVIPDAFRCEECFLYEIDDCIEHFKAERSTRGYEYQAVAMTEDIIAGAAESSIMTLEKSLQFQDTIDTIKREIGVSAD